MQKLIAIFLLTALLCGCAAVPEKTQPEITTTAASTQTEQQTNAAPDFRAVDRQGKEVKLSDFQGKPVVLNFWASWCGPCKREMPDFQDKYLELGEKVQFLMVNLTDGEMETMDSALEFLAGEAYTFPVLFDTFGEGANGYYVYSIPTTFFIDAEGNLIAQANGAIDGETLQKGIDMILE